MSNDTETRPPRGKVRRVMVRLHTDVPNDVNDHLADCDPMEADMRDWWTPYPGGTTWNFAPIESLTFVKKGKGAEPLAWLSLTALDGTQFKPLPMPGVPFKTMSWHDGCSITLAADDA